MNKIKTGLFGIGLDTYWGQFDGLLDKLNSYLGITAQKLSGVGAEVINAGMVDNPARAITAAEIFSRNSVDLVVLNISTYALSHNVLPLLQRTAAPVLVLNLQPLKALDYSSFNALGDRGKMTGEWLSLCQSCVTPELANVFRRAGIRYNLITGFLDDEESWREIGEWIDAVRARKVLMNNRLGVIGHYYNGMLDVYSDMTRLAAVFGCHFELMEFGELKSLFDSVTPGEIAIKTEQFRQWFEVSDECPPDDLEVSARSSVALDKLVKQKDLGSLAYFYEGAGDESYERIVTTLIPGMTLLTGRHVPAAGECEIKNAIAMKIMDSFNAGGSFSEFYLTDFEKDEILLGHDGPAHFMISEGKVKLVPLPVFHGKPGKGLSIQMKVATGPVTLLSVCETRNGEVMLLCAEGESVDGPTLQIANTNSRYRFPLPARQFINRWSQAGPSHHCAIGTGHISARIEKLAGLLGAGFLKVC